MDGAEGLSEAMMYTLVAIGGALGSIARYWCSGLAARTIGETFPWGTIIVNIVGSFIIGFAATAMGPDGRMFVGNGARTFVMVGICGGFTTFSSFSLQTLALLREGETWAAILNVTLSVVLGLLAAWAGQQIATMIWLSR